MTKSQIRREARRRTLAAYLRLHWLIRRRGDGLWLFRR